MQQWDGKAWKIISGWYTANQEVTEPLVKDVSAKYAAEKKITPRDCAKESYDAACRSNELRGRRRSPPPDLP